MFVKLQDETIVLNNDKVTEYFVSDKWDGQFKVIALVEGRQVVMGRYSTKDKCVIVLNMLLECQTMNLMINLGTIQEFNIRQNCSDYVGTQQLGIFEMPQEKEVYEDRTD